MRMILLTAALLSASFGAPKVEVPGAATSPYIKLTEVVKDGTLRVSLKNISNKRIVAYVVGVDNGGQTTTTHRDSFTGRDAFAPGKTIELVFAVASTSSTPKVFVDFVRLSDASTWGNALTDDGKDVAASFKY